MQEIFYEESVDTHNQSSAKRKYTVYKVVSIVAAVFAALAIFNLFFGIPVDSDEGMTTAVVIAIVIMVIAAVAMIFVSIFFGRKKHAFFLSYDYTFVTGELRISKVFNNRRRKHLYAISTDKIIKIGRVGSETYAKTKRMPETKEDILTPNVEAEDGKEFFYIYTQTNVGKKILILECRMQLIVTIIRFINRPGILETEFNKQSSAGAKSAR